MQDVRVIMDHPEFERVIRRIRGQRSGISLIYFYMMCGSETHVKPARMVLRYLSRVLKRQVSAHEVQPLVTRASHALNPKYPHMTPRLLDTYIWQYERKRKLDL